MPTSCSVWCARVPTQTSNIMYMDALRNHVVVILVASKLE